AGSYLVVVGLESCAFETSEFVALIMTCSLPSWNTAHARFSQSRRDRPLYCGEGTASVCTSERTGGHHNVKAGGIAALSTPSTLAFLYFAVLVLRQSARWRCTSNSEDRRTQAGSPRRSLATGASAACGSGSGRHKSGARCSLTDHTWAAHARG